MNLPELSRALRQLRLGGIAATLEMRLKQAQSERMVHLDFLSTLVQDELTRRSDRLLDRRRKQAAFRDAHKTLDTFDFDFNKKMDRHLIFELANGRVIALSSRPGAPDGPLDTPARAFEPVAAQGRHPDLRRFVPTTSGSPLSHPISQ